MRNAVCGLFHLVYRVAKRCGPLDHVQQDASTATLVGMIVAQPTAPYSACGILHATVAPISASEGEPLRQSCFFAFASDSSTARNAHKEELVYAQTVRMGRSHTAV